MTWEPKNKLDDEDVEVSDDDDKDRDDDKHGQLETWLASSTSWLYNRICGSLLG